MYEDSETRSKVLQDWCALVGLEDFVPYAQFYTDNGVLSSPSDLYKLSLRHLYTHPDIPDDVAYSVSEGLAGTTELSYARVLLVLLPDLDPSEIRKVVEVPRELDELVDLCKNSLYAAGFREELCRLHQLGIKMSFGDDPIFEVEDATPFTGKKVVVAGRLSDEHDVVKSALASIGASIQDSITKETDFLILGEGAHEEVDLAIKIGVRVLTEMDVAAILGVV
jgi:hypothetical protein